MYTVIAKNLCGCFKLREGEFTKEFEDQNEALEHTKKICKKSNLKFCKKHHFFYEIENNEIIIKMKVVK